jgi:UDP-N-acetylmuramyl pentapeptide synthase
VINQQQINRLLAFFARKIIAKHQPLVIGITGSVGKTTTRHAVACALSAKYFLREPEKNFNNEIGIPLTVIGAKGLDEDTGFLARKFGWIRIFAEALVVWLIPQNYPKVLVLEYGIDHPGDMDALVSIVRPNIAVLTTIGISHREHFDKPEDIAFEKGKLAASLPENGTYVYNLDDPNVAAQTSRTKAKLISYGKAGHSASQPDVMLTSVEEHLEMPPATKLHFKTPTREISVTIPVVGTAHESSILAAIAVAESLDIDTELILKGLSSYRAVPGRLNILPGIKRTILIDDTYNAAPLSMSEALQLLARFDNPVKIAVLGDMRELGDLSDQAHAQIGELASRLGLSKLVTVGELGKKIAESAQAHGMAAEAIESYDNSREAAANVLKNLEPESVILIKGSQAVRMEKITKELLAEPTSATSTLVRQYGKWLHT